MINSSLSSQGADQDHSMVMSASDTVVSLFAKQVHLTPHKVAIQHRFDNFQTYAQLDRDSKSIAHALIKHDIKPKALIAIFSDKRPSMVAAYLGILTVRSAYVPLEPDHPPSRTRSTVEDIQPDLILAPQEQLDDLSGRLAESTFSHNHRILSIESLIDRGQKLPQPQQPLPSPLPSDLAYILFTSGTTGRPKGVCISHANLVASISASHDVIKLGPCALRTALFSAMTFDMCVWDLWTTLLSGATLCIASKSEFLHDLVPVLDQFAATFLQTTPTILSLIPAPRSVPFLSLLLSGGEPMTVSLRNIFSPDPTVTLINGYGPTEATVYAIQQRVHLDSDVNVIGRPIGANKVHIIDPQTRTPCQVGQPGELAIQGPQVGLGYFKDPTYTAAKFLFPSFGSVQGHSTYLTGDVCRMNQDGTISYLGRADDQVKIRGFRVELGEVEATIAAHPTAIRAACMKVSNALGKDALVAFVVPSSTEPSSESSSGCTQAISSARDKQSSAYQSDHRHLIPNIALAAHFQPLASQLDQHLRSQLPIYMVPAYFIPIASLPMTLNNKVDRKALGFIFDTLRENGDIFQFSSQDALPSRTIIAPCTPQQRAVHARWCALFACQPDQLSIHDPFISMGGDSLLAVQLSTALREVGVDCHARQIMQTTNTVEMQARLAEDSNSSTDSDESNEPRSHAAALLPPHSPPPPFSLLKRFNAENALQDPVIVALQQQSPIQDCYPCTAMQEGLVSVNFKSDSHSSLYMAKSSNPLPLDVDVHRLQVAWAQLVKCQSSLRTSFVLTECGLVQVVLGADHPASPPLLISNHFSDMEEQNYSKYHPRLVAGQVPVKAWICTGSNSAVPRLVLWMHHALMDGTSLRILSRQLATLYAAGEHAKLGTVPSYSSFVNHVLDLDPVTCQDYWKKYLEDMVTTHPWEHGRIGGDDNESRTPQSRSAKYHARWNGDLWSWCQHQQVTPAVAVQLVVYLALRRVTSSADVTFGLVSNGRRLQQQQGRKGSCVDFDQVVGACVAVLPMRFRFETTTEISEALSQMTDRFYQSVEYEHGGLQVIRQLSANAGRSPLPLFLTYQNVSPILNGSQDALQLDLLSSVSEMELDVPFNLNLEPLVQEKSILITATVDASTVDPILAKSFVDLLQQGLNCLLSLPDQAVLSDIDLLSPTHKKHLCDTLGKSQEPDLNRLDPDFEGCASVWDRFQVQVSQTPKKVAIQDSQGEFLTYRELENRALRVASALIAHGVNVTKETLIPTFARKAAPMFVSYLGIMRAGAAFVPLDPGHPALRTLDTIEDLRAEIILTDLFSRPELERRIQAMGSEFHPKVFAVEELLAQSWPLIEGPHRSSPERLCYVIHTSGTTGRPKGVCVEHKSVLASIAGSRQVHGSFGTRLRTAQFSGCCFDVIVWDWGMTLLSGGTLCVTSRQDYIDNGTSETIDRFACTLIETTPSILAFIEPPKVPFLQTILPGGEPLTVQVQKTFSRDFNLVVVYGPSEIVVNALYRRVGPTGGLNRVGRPFGSNRVYVLDPDGKLCPAGVPGELAVAGPQVSRGYLGQAELSAARFVRNTISNDGQGDGRMYLTGDVVCWVEGGELAFLGRKDDQFKIRGFRIEPSEIETTIAARFPTQVSRAACIKVKQKGGQDGLVAFVVVRHPSSTNENVSSSALCSSWMCGDIQGGTTVDNDKAHLFRPLAKQLLSELTKTLPSHMVPSLMFPIDAMPMTANGKIDRRKLLAWHTVLRNQGHERLFIEDPLSQIELPATTEEEQLHSLWSSVLHIEPKSLSVVSHFYSVGGDSLTSMRLSSAAKAISLHLPVRVIHAYPTIREQGRWLQSQGSANVAVGCLVSSIEPFSLMQSQEEVSFIRDLHQGIEDCLPCTPLQEALVSLNLKSAKCSTLYISKASIPLPSYICIDRLRKAWSSLIAEYAAIRTAFFATENGIRQIVFPPGHPQTPQLEHFIAESLDIDAFQPEFRMGECPIWVQLQSHATTGAMMLNFGIHHALSDGTTLNLLSYRLDRLYRGLETIEPSPPYAYFVKSVLDNHSKRAASYWSSMLAGVQSPTWPKIVSRHGFKEEEFHRSINVSRSWGGSLHEWCKGQITTPATAFQLVLSRVLSIFSMNDDITFGLVSDGRTSLEACVDLNKIAGACVAVVPVRTQLHSGMTIRTALDTVASITREAIANEHLGLVEIHRSAGVPTSTSLFTTMLTYQNIAVYEAEDSLLPIDLMRSTNQMDMDVSIALNVEETPNGLTISSNYNTVKVSRVSVDKLLKALTHGLSSLLSLKSDNQLGDVQFWDENLMHADAMRRSAVTAQHVPALEVEANYCRFNSINECLDYQYRSVPKKVAIQCNDSEYITYARLEERAGMVARALFARGIKTQDMVPFFAEKCSELFIALVAILRVGAAYVPLEPDHPSSRTASLVEQINPGLVISSSGMVDELGCRLMSQGTVVVTVEELEKEGQAMDRVDFPVVAPQSAAYVLFTSGTTGTPKGVCVEHGSVLASITGSHEVHSTFGKRLRTAMFSSVGFDVSTWDIGMTLFSGGTLCIAPKETYLDDMSGTLDRFAATLLETTPTIMGLVEERSVPFLRTLLPGGEPLTTTIRDRFAAEFELVGVYGPSEIVVNALYKRFDSRSDTSILGRPFGQNRVYVVDEVGRVCPPGIAGQLVVAGPQVARGYLGNELLTSQQFRPDEISGRTNQRMYFTGDLVRWTEETDEVEFLGRSDDQFKIRGLRIEPAEVEACLMRLFSGMLSRVACIKVTNTRGQDALAAFVKLSQDQASIPGRDLPSAAEPSPNDDGDTLSALLSNEPADSFARMVAIMLEELKLHLATQMIPSLFFPINVIPMTANNKIDRRRLASLHAVIARKGQEFVYLPHPTESQSSSVTNCPPRTPLESTLQGAWASVLRMKPEKISTSDSFMALGGDSLLSVRLSAKARKLGLNLSVDAIVRFVTISEQARYLTSSQVENHVALPSAQAPEPFSLLGSDEQQEITDRIRPDFGDIEDCMPCTSLQESLVSINLRSRGDSKLYMSFGHIELPSHVEFHRLSSAWKMLLRHHPVLRTVFVLMRHGLRQLVLSHDHPGLSSLETASGMDATLENFVPSFELGACPLRIAMVSDRSTEIGSGQDRGRRYLAFAIHHALSDGTSLDLISKRLGLLYFRLAQPIAQLPFSAFVKHSLMLDQTHSISVWKQYLTNCPRPTWPQASSEDVRTSKKKSINICKRWSGDIARWCRLNQTTPAAAVQLVVANLIALRSNSSDIVYGLTSTGRTMSGTCTVFEDVVGPCVTVLPTRYTVNPSETLSTSLERIRNSYRTMLEHQHVGLAAIQRSLGHTAHRGIGICSVLLTYQNFSAPTESPESHIDTDTDTDAKADALNIDLFRGLDSMQLDFGISLNIESESNGLSLWANIDTNILSKEDGEAFLELMASALSAIVKSDANNTTIQSWLMVLAPKDPHISPFLAHVPSSKQENAIKPDDSPDNGPGSNSGRETHVFPAEEHLDPAQSKIRAIWASILRMDETHIRLDDNFLNLGGDSVLGLSIAGAAKFHGLSLTVSAVLKYPTVRLQAANSVPLQEAQNTDSPTLPEPFSLMFEPMSSEEARQQVATSCGNVSAPDVEDAMRCTPIQEALVGLSLAAEADSSDSTQSLYLSRMSASLSANVDIGRLREAWSRLVTRQPIMRTVFYSSRKGIQQAILTHQSLLVRRTTYVMTLHDREESITPLRFTLGVPACQADIVMGDSTSAPLFVLQMHHALFDGSSLDILSADLGRLYYNLHSDTIGLPYSIFVSSALSVQQDASLAFWSRYMEGNKAVEWPIEAASASHTPLSKMPNVEALDWQGDLLSLTKRLSVTGSTLIKQCLAIVIGKYTETDDVIFGSVGSGRTSMEGIELQNIVGPCAAVTPLRVHLSSTRSFRDAALTLHKETLELLAHEHVGLSNIQRRLNTNRRRKLFNLLLTYQGLQTIDPTMASKLPVDLVNSDTEMNSEIALCVNAIPLKNGGLTLKVTCSDNSLVSTAHWLARHVIAVLEAVDASDGNVLLKDLTLLDPEQQHMLQHSWCLSSHPHSEPQIQLEVPIISQIETAMKEVPHKIAIQQSSSERFVTYLEADRISMALAQLIDKELSAKNWQEREVVVPIFIPKSTEYFLAVYGVLRAGLAFCPLDVSHPRERTRNMVETVRPPLVLTTASLRQEAIERISSMSLPTATVIAIDDPLPRSELPELFSRRLSLNSDSLLAVIFTSGTSGKPKGVRLHNQMVVSMLEGAIQFGQLPSQSLRVGAVLNIAFDPSLVDAFLPLLRGGTLCVITKEEYLESATDALAQAAANVSFSAPSLLSLLDASQTPYLGFTVSGGEPLTADVQARLASHVTLINAYGPTETAVAATMRLVGKDDRLDLLGRPFGFNRAYILDCDRNPCAVNVPGELFIAGKQVSMGYFGKPELSAQRFFQDTVSDSCEERMYATGDLARWAPDGHLVLHGRIDSQVKLNGYRIELEDVESGIMSSSAALVRQAVCVKAFIGDQERLVAFVVPSDDQKLQCPAVKIRWRAECQVLWDEDYSASVPGTQQSFSWFSLLARKIFSEALKVLPVYMAPSTIVPVTSIPISSNHKIDRPRLVQILDALAPASILGKNSSGVKGVNADAAFHSSMSPAESALIKIWSETFGVQAESIGIDDDFLFLGGDSLLAVRLSAIAQEHGLVLTVSDVMRHSTITQQASVAQFASTELDDGLSSKTGYVPFSTLRPDFNAQQLLPETSQIEDCLPCTPMQESLILETIQSQNISQVASRYMTTMVSALSPQVQPTRLQQAWSHVQSRHSILRTCFTSTEEGAFQLVLKSSSPLLSAFNVVHLDSADQFTAWLENKTRSFTFSFGQQPMTISLVTSSAKCNSPVHLVLQMHHGLYDGYSIQLLSKELSVAYQSGPGSLPSLDPLAFSSITAKMLDDERRRKSCEFWKKALVGAQVSKWPRLASRFVTPEEQSRSDSDGSTNGQASGEWLGDLHSWCASQRVTIASAVRFALGWILASYTGEAEAVFGIISSGRSSLPGSTRIVGPCVANTPVRVRIVPSETLGSTVRQTHTHYQESVEHEHLGLSEILRVSNLNLRPGAFGVLLTLQNLGSALGEQDASAQSSSEGIMIDLTQSASMMGMEVPVHVSVTPLDGRLSLSVACGAGVDFRDGEMLLEHLKAALDAMVGNNPESCLDSLSFVCQREKNQLITYRPSATKNPNGLDAPAHEIIAKVASELPHKMAIQRGDHTFCTYRELDMRSSLMADNLVRLGVGPGCFTPIISTKSVEAIIAMVAVLKSGAAYVMMSPSNPEQRLREMISQCSSPVAIIEEDSVMDQDSLTSSHFIPTVTFAHLELDQGAQLLQCRPTPMDAPAYVLFTSGTTGTPKGVVVDHDNLHAYIHSQQGSAISNRQTRRYCFASLTFDVSVGDIYSTLCSGACLCIENEDQMLTNLARSMSQMAATAADLTPTVAQLIRHQELATLQLLFLSGEPVPQDLALELRHKYELINTCGPTETVVQAMAHRFVPSDDDRPFVPLGRPTGDMRITIVKPGTVEPLPTGCCGEMIISGPQVSKGYLGDPAKTAERYLDDPFLRNGQKAFRSGDLGRIHADGCIEHLGRLDTQIKLHGLRIDTGEIEAAIMLSGEVAHCAVSKLENGAGHDMLVAHVSLKEEQRDCNEDSSVSLVWRSIQQRLPSYMHPNYLAIHQRRKQLAFTSSGKVDRRLLDRLVLEADASVILVPQTPLNFRHIEPRNPTEHQVREAWSAVLALDPAKISIQATFSQMGGDSIRSMRLLTKLQSMGVEELLISHVDPSSTVATQAASALELRQSGSGPTSNVVPLRVRSANTRALIMVHDFTGTVFAYSHLAGYMVEGVDVYGIADPFLGKKPRTADGMPDSIQVIAEAYWDQIEKQGLLKKYGADNIWLGGWSFGGVIACHMVQQHSRSSPVSTCAGLVLLDSLCPLSKSVLENATILSSTGTTSSGQPEEDFELEERNKWACRLQAAYDVSEPLLLPTLFISAASTWQETHESDWLRLTKGKAHIVRSTATHAQLLSGPENTEKTARLISQFFHHCNS